METIISVRHQTWETKTPFSHFTAQLEQRLGRFKYPVYERLLAEPETARAELEAMAGEQGLMLFSIQEHGQLLNLVGKSRLAKQYILGNPLIAIEMTKHDIRAGLYAPLRLLVYENAAGSVTVEYDLPSSLFGQFNNAAVTEVARKLDQKVADLIKSASAV